MTTLDVQPVSIRVKQSTMDERKRSAHYDNDESGPPLKRQATGVNGSSKSKDGEERDPELEVFQKEAALRQMHEYKRQKIVIEKEYNDLMKKASAHDDHIRAVDSWFSQLLDEIRIAVNKYREGVPFSVFPSNILLGDFETFETHLKKRASQVAEDLRAIFSKGHDREPTIAELQAEVAKLMATAKKQANDIEKTRLDNEATNERLETASMRYMVAEKKLDRMKSQSVQKLEQQALASSAETSKPAVEKTDGQDTVALQALQDAEVALQAALAETAKQAEQLQALEEDKQKLASQLTEAQVKTTQHTDDEFAQTELFKQFKKQLEDFINRVNGLEASNNELRRETKRLQEERAAYRTEVDTELHVSTSEHHHHLSRLEADLARIRTARDELQAEKVVQETTFRNDKAAVAQLQEVVAGKDERIKTLESETARLAGIAGESTSDLDEIPIEELRTRFSRTTKELSMMKTELDSMGKAYTKLTGSMSSKFFNQSEIEEKMQKLSAEKAKADQKYFSAMKSKDTFAAEVKTLRAQNAKSSEMIASFKALESASRQQLMNLEKQVAESKHAFAALENKHRAIESQVSDKTSQLDTFKKQIDDLKSLLSTKDTESSSLQSQLRKSELAIERVRTTLSEKEKQFETYKKSAVNTAGNSDSSTTVTEQLRSMALCNVCRMQFKDRIIVHCGHTFCKDCLDDRVANRMRKCPNCNMAFGKDDVRPMVL